MYIVFAMISCSGSVSKDTQPTDTETTPADTFTEDRPKWTGLDLGPDGLCLVAEDDSHLCISHSGAEYSYDIPQVEHLSVGDGFGCALVTGRSPSCSGDLSSYTPTGEGGYSDLQTGSTFACALRYPHTDIDCWGVAQPPYDLTAGHELYAVGPYSLCSAKYVPASVECFDTRGIDYRTHEDQARLLDMTVGDDRVCTLYESDGVSWGLCGSLSENNHSAPIDINGLGDPLLIQAASDDTLLCGLAADGAVQCSDLIDIPPTGRLTFPVRSSTVRDFDAHAGIACVLYGDSKVTCLGLDTADSKIPAYSLDFLP